MMFVRQWRVTMGIESQEESFVKSQPASASESVPSSTDSPSTTLRGRWLVLARVGWLGIAILTLALFVAGVAADFARLQVPCPTDACLSTSGQLTPAERGALADLGLSLGFYAAYAVALDVVFAAVYVVIAALIFWRPSTDRFALFVALALLTFGTATFPYSFDALLAAQPTWGLALAVLDVLGSICFILFLYLFPDGRFVPRWTRWVALAWITWLVVLEYGISPQPDVDTWLTGFNLVVWAGALGAVVYAQVYRYRRVSNRVRRQQTWWVVFGIAAALTGYLGISVALTFLVAMSSTASVFAILLIGVALLDLSLLLIPLSIALAMLRYHLFDVDVLIRRTLVYGALTGCVVGLYVLIVGSLGALFQSSGNLLIALLATGLVAVVFQPLRERLQRGVSQLIYGERDDPYRVLARLGQRLDATLAPDAVLPTIAETISQALKLPYAAIILNHDGMLSTTAAVGTPVADPLQLPLTYQGATIGQLVLGPRAPDEPFSLADRRLLEDLAHQVAVAARAVRLTAELQQLALDLQHSRARLVVAREEERRRLRRDLHDGLGPTLAALALSASAIPDLIPTDPAGAAALAQQLETDIRATVGEIRRLIHGLRPPALDELGLVGAVRDRAAQLTRRQRAMPADSLQMLIETPDTLPPLPAAVEVAAYRIVEEALTNVARHAQARICTVRLSLTDALEVEIVDDGIGLPAARRAGVGLLSIRERAAELGGACAFEVLGDSGTRVYARLPLPKE